MAIEKVIDAPCSKETKAIETKLINKKWTLKKRPQGEFVPERDLELVEEVVDLQTLQVPKGECVVKIEMLSVDAFVRTTLREGAYHGTVPIGGVVPALGYGRVLKSGDGGPEVGSYCTGRVGAQMIAMGPFTPMGSTYGLPHSTSLGLFGVSTGLTAYVGVFAVTKQPTEGEVCVVSAAAGAVGSIAAQLAKSTGAKVIGIAGGAVKCAWLKDTLKLDGVIDYKDLTCSLGEQLDRHCPDGINFFYDNVGGETLDEVLLRIAPKGRIVICGAISQYSRKAGEKVLGPSNYLALARRGATMVGYNVTQYMDVWEEGLETLRALHGRDELDIHETTFEGIGSFGFALRDLFAGKHIGKTLVDVGQPTHRDQSSF